MRRDSAGAYEAALLNTPVADPNRPLEILRTVHSFDPCIACAVHVIDAQGREYTIPARRLRKGDAYAIRDQRTNAPRSHALGPPSAHAGRPHHCGLCLAISAAPVHWGLVISIGVLSFTGYYIHNPFIVGQTKYHVPDGLVPLRA